ncbi:copper chaperone Atx1p [Diutina catenulata]
MTKHYQFNVTMSCGGCSGAIERVLNKTEGVQSVKTDLETQLVDVETDDSVSYDTVLEKISKTGKKVNSGTTI